MKSSDKQPVPELYALWSKSAGVINCILRLDSLQTKSGLVKVDVEATCMKVAVSGHAIRFSLPGVTLQPKTCRSLKYMQSGELHFSMKGSLLSDTTTEEATNGQHLSNQRRTVDAIEVLQDKWYCAICRQKVLNDWCFFNRVLPLPSENWSESSDMWFCHSHGNINGVDDEKPETGKKKLLPGLKECFVGGTYLLVARRYVNEGSVKLNKTGAVMCRRCGKQLGVAMETEKGSSNGDTVFKLYLHAVMIKDYSIADLTNQTSIDRFDMDGFFSRLIMEHCQTYSSYRFIIDTESPPQSMPGKGSESTTAGVASGTSVCLLWLLDPSVTVFTSGSHVGTSKLDSKPGTVVETCVQQNTTMKLLFQCQLHTRTPRRVDPVTKSVISLWRKDNSVHGVSMPHPVFLQLLQHLVHNSTHLPPSQRYLNGFHVSYLQHATR